MLRALISKKLAAEERRLGVPLSRDPSNPGAGGA
jgi:hypothetical protein